LALDVSIAAPDAAHLRRPLKPVRVLSSPFNITAGVPNVF
jgi:hypothetical protein